MTSRQSREKMLVQLRERLRAGETFDDRSKLLHVSLGHCDVADSVTLPVSHEVTDYLVLRSDEFGWELKDVVTGNSQRVAFCCKFGGSLFGSGLSVVSDLEILQ
jgi:hypothetical protein